MKIPNLEISHGIEPTKQSFYFKRERTMKKVILNCKVQSYFGIELLKSTLNDLIESNSKISIVEIDCDDNK